MDYKKQITDAAEMNAAASFSYGRMKIEIRTAYKNGSVNPEEWTYCVSAYKNGKIVWCENGATIGNAATAVELFAITKKVN